MRRLILTISALLVALSAAAQVEREIEVTKQYVPKLPPARKMDFQPDMVDTVSIRPEIDYTIAPKSFDSALTSEKFRPATVTYWEYVKHYPFYIKAGAGYPLVTEVDAYASANRADVGYVSAYINHRGSFADIKVDNPFTGEQYCRNSQQMSNRIGFNGGKYVGRYTFNGDIFYSSDAFRRYAQPTPEDQNAEVVDQINYEDVGVKLNFGDSFADMKRLNFDLYIAANYYNDKSHQLPALTHGLLTGGESTEQLPAEGETIEAVNRKVQQLDLAMGLLFGRNIGNRSVIKAAVEYQGYYGMQFTKSYRNNLIGGYVAYQYHHTKLFDIKAKVGYMFDNVPAVADGKARHHLLPELYAGFDVKNNGTFVPYVEVDSKLANNSYRELQRINPYVMLYDNQYTATPNSLTYNLRAGFAGHTLNNMFAYRLYANAAFITDAVYWYNVNNIGFDFQTARQNIYSVVASLEYKPLSTLFIGVGLKGMFYKNFIDIENGKPAIEGDFAIRYTHNKFAVGATAEFIGARSWSFIGQPGEGVDQYTMQSHKYSACVDLGVTFDWFVSKQCTIYLEGRNLANAKIYEWALYRRLGVGGLAGIKVQF